MSDSPDLEKVIDSDRHEIIGFLNRGWFGAVYEAKDRLNNQIVALKVLDPSDQGKAIITRRKLDEAEFMRKEAGEPLAALANVIAHFPFVDKNGKHYVVMRKYDTFLDGILNDGGSRRYLNNGLSQAEINQYLCSLANGLREMHTVLKKPHCDIKPDNIAVDNGSLLLADLGTSTFPTVGRSPSDRRGFLYTQPPQCGEFWSDVWSFGSLAYRMFTGKYVLEDELNNAVDPELFLVRLEPEVGNALIKNKLKLVPRRFRKLLFDCLNFCSYERIKDGAELKSRVDGVVDSFGAWKSFKNLGKKALMFGVPVVLAAFALYKGAIFEPTELKMPKVSTWGQLGKPGLSDCLEFEREDLPLDDNPPYVKDSLVKNASNNRFVVYLLKAYAQACRKLDYDFFRHVNEAQWDMSYVHSMPNELNQSLTDPYIKRIGRCIEVAMTQSQTPSGKVDLEDTCTVARLGVDKVNEARRAANSFDFKNYIAAKDNDGNSIIPETEQEFLRTWLSYIKD